MQPRFKSSWLLDFYRICCEGDEKSYFSNQDMIFRSLIEDKQMRKNLISISSDESDFFTISVTDYDGLELTVLLDKFLSDSTQDGHIHFVNQLNYLNS